MAPAYWIAEIFRFTFERRRRARPGTGKGPSAGKSEGPFFHGGRGTIPAFSVCGDERPRRSAAEVRSGRALARRLAKNRAFRRSEEPRGHCRAEPTSPAHRAGSLNILIGIFPFCPASLQAKAPKRRDPFRKYQKNRMPDHADDSAFHGSGRNTTCFHVSDLSPSRGARGASQ